MLHRSRTPALVDRHGGFCITTNFGFHLFNLLRGRADTSNVFSPRNFFQSSSSRYCRPPMEAPSIMQTPGPGAGRKWDVSPKAAESDYRRPCSGGRFVGGTFFVVNRALNVFTSPSLSR